MENVLLLDKPLGVTPLACISAWRSTHPEYAGLKLGYAGRLDPMAEGLLVVLVGDENKLRSDYLGLEKEYTVTIACGVSTDTHDVMGLVQESTSVTHPPSQQTLKDVLNTFIGDIKQEYPSYSSKTVNGIPLYRLAREGRLCEIDIPIASRHISEIELKSLKMMPADMYVHDVHAKLAHVTSGDFRLEAIRDAWDVWLKQIPSDFTLSLITLRVVCSSGTYMRMLAYEIGKALGYPASACMIKRTRVGPYSLPPAGQ